MKRKIKNKNRNAIIIVVILAIAIILFAQSEPKGFYISGSSSTESKCSERISEACGNYDFKLGCKEIDDNFVNCLTTRGNEEGVLNVRELNKFLDQKDFGEFVYQCFDQEEIDMGNDRANALKVVAECMNPSNGNGNGNGNNGEDSKDTMTWIIIIGIFATGGYLLYRKNVR